MRAPHAAIGGLGLARQADHPYETLDCSDTGAVSVGPVCFNGMSGELNGHRTAELRSLAYHRRIAEELASDSQHLARARQRVAEWLAAPERNPEYARRWQSWLSAPLADLVNFLSSDTEEARDLRQGSPFAGALTPRARWEIWRQQR